MYNVLKTFQSQSYQNGLNWSRSCFSPDGNHIAAGSIGIQDHVHFIISN